MASSESSALLRDAVSNSKGGSGFLQRLFAVWFDAFVYNQIWEDPRVDLEALELDGDSRVLTISSGGCNAMNYLLASPGHVTAVDLNRHHIALLKLKIAAAAALERHEDYFGFFGAGSNPDNPAKFESAVAPELDDEARSYWMGRSGLLRRKRVRMFQGRGLYDHSRNGYFLRFFHGFAKVIGLDPAAVLLASNEEEQVRCYEEQIDPFFDSVFIRLAGKMPVTLFGLGIPPQQYDELKEDLEEGGSLIDVYRERTRRLAAGFPISDNYFAWQALARRYDTEGRKALPEYLKEENYALLRSMVPRISARVGSVTAELRDNPAGTYNRFVFLDAQDWMAPEGITELWDLIASRGDTASRVIFRTAGRKSPLESALPADLLERFEYHEDWSRELFSKDRASIYGGFHLYTLR